MSKVTRWFPPEVKPVHIGSYETRRYEQSEEMYCSWWNGRYWALDSFLHGETEYIAPSIEQDRPWRGLKEKPE